MSSTTWNRCVAAHASVKKQWVVLKVFLRSIKDMWREAVNRKECKIYNNLNHQHFHQLQLGYPHFLCTFPTICYPLLTCLHTPAIFEGISRVFRQISLKIESHIFTMPPKKFFSKNAHKTLTKICCWLWSWTERLGRVYLSTTPREIMQ